ncbi:LytR C-terminal domain-containing protein [Phytoactinopolyspora halotolerans]|uniref:LytR C-terminal domain-containing protein n=1 Tax=Phytoactinopolyspora halotolerans TaxID=1981512 RepID=A0A6L9S224_9ACTN|nr:LytR C-terminal domain-containing protein [Phytoactinopolyspora halotolerans]NED99265.1 LytR C-terminal domain-containing protein [Phytoactinopolyspora halotolerans]
MEPGDPTDRYELTDAEDDYRPRHTWRHVRTAVTLLVLVAFVVGAAWYSWNNVMEPTDADDAGDTVATCPTMAPTDAPPPEEIEVNVYNATDRGGLARDVAGTLRDRGFAVLDVANDPLDKTVEETAEIRLHPDSEAAASLLASMVPDAVLVREERDSQAVDLVLGEAFDELAAMPGPDATDAACP